MVVSILHYGRGFTETNFKSFKRISVSEINIFFKLLDGQAVLLNLTKTLLVLKDFISLREYSR